MSDSFSKRATAEGVRGSVEEVAVGIEVGGTSQGNFPVGLFICFYFSWSCLLIHSLTKIS